MFLNIFNSPEKKVWDHFMISDHNFEVFQDCLTEKKIKQLYLKLKEYEEKGYVKYHNYFISMRFIFDSDILPDENKNINNNSRESSINSDNCSSESENISNKNSYFSEIYDLIFKRFREIKCIIKNNKNIFYLTDFKKENYINSYNLVCALTIFLKKRFENKIKLLFDLTDIDEDGYLNRNEIEFMITTINQLFGEEVSTINTHSSILSQSLTNIKINNILYELTYGQGDLNNKYIEQHNYINFQMFYNGVKKIKNYKYRIIPCFINFRDCLFSHKKEKMINVKEKIKKDFINISSELALELNKNNTKNKFKKLSFKYLNEIMKPFKINKNITIRKATQKSQVHSHNKYRNSIKEERNIFIKSDKSLKELIKNSTLLNDEQNNELNSDNKDSLIKNNNYFQYVFQANFNDIKNIEVEPGIIKFLPSEIEKNNDKITKSFNLSKSPETRNKYKNNILNKNKPNNLAFSLNKILEYGKEEKNSNNNNSINKKEINNNFKKIFSKKRYDSLSTKHLTKYFIEHVRLKHSNSTYMKKSKNKIIINSNSNPERYKTLNEIMSEINNQQKIFNYDSINQINSEIIREYKKMQVDINNFRKTFSIFIENKKNSINLKKFRNKRIKEE